MSTLKSANQIKADLALLAATYKMGGSGGFVIEGTHDAMAQALEYIEQLERLVPVWHEVETSPPALGERVVLYSPRGSIFVGKRYVGSTMNDKGVITFHSDNCGHARYATHWMKAPEGPGECKGDEENA